MRNVARIGLALAVAFGLTVMAQAADEAKSVTLKGEVMCAKCTLKKADATECQDVLVVSEGDAKGEYYVVKNDVAEKFGHVCSSKKAAKVTGTVAEKDGKKWITASAMEAAS
jgi:hypothetical protein